MIYRHSAQRVIITLGTVGEFGSGLSKRVPPRPLVARLLPGLNTLLHTLSLLRANDAERGVVGVTGVTGLTGIDRIYNDINGTYGPLIIIKGDGLVVIFLSLPSPRSGEGPATTSSHSLSSRTIFPGDISMSLSPNSLLVFSKWGFHPMTSKGFVESSSNLEYLQGMFRHHHFFNFFIKFCTGVILHPQFVSCFHLMLAVVLSSPRMEAIIAPTGYGDTTGILKGLIQHLHTTFLCRSPLSRFWYLWRSLLIHLFVPSILPVAFLSCVSLSLTMDSLALNISKILNLTDREAVVHDLEDDTGGENVDQSLAAAVSQFLTTEDIGSGSSGAASRGNFNETGSLGVDHVQSSIGLSHEGSPLSHDGFHSAVICDLPFTTTQHATVTASESSSEGTAVEGVFPRISKKDKGKVVAGAKRAAFLPQTVVVGV
ncbi:hypothetical protein F8388_023855 [Cannabis sativa]|uniref:Uncharacterized protein n=1 Tax=Cannabis sativa TaxID=3483 RepID=A0A7J6DVA3_CANSA|nr:hypothetical protein F8388_023855 [Cannabis sativa]